MKWELGKLKHDGEWRPWFAWYLVIIENHIVWLQWIERRQYWSEEVSVPDASGEPMKYDARRWEYRWL